MERSETAERVCARVGIDAPGMGLLDLEQQGPGRVSARLTLRAPEGPEASSPQAADVTRRLVALGACAAATALDDDMPRRYRVTGLHYLRAGDLHDAVDQGEPASLLAWPPTGDPVLAEATSVWVVADRVRTEAVVSAGPDRPAAVHLTIDYSVRTPPVRPDGPIDLTGDRAPGFPYALAEEVEELVGGVRVDCGTVPDAICDIEAPGRPVVPVAAVMERLVRAMGWAMVRHLGYDGHRYRVEQAELVSTVPVHRGRRLELIARYLEPCDDGHRIEGVARVDGEEAVTLRSVLSIHEPAPDDEDDA